MSNTIPILQFLFKNEWPVLNSSLKTNPLYEVEAFSTANDLATYLSGLDAALIISSLMNKEDLITIATFVKLQKKIAKDAIAKVVVINFSGDKQFERALAKLGIQDVIDPTISTKPLRYKIDFWMKSLTAQTKKAQDSAARSLKGAESKAPEAKTSDSSIKWEAPLECVDDVWIIKNDSDCKRILSKWLIKVMGPSPYTGQWTEIPGKSDLWRFEFNSDFKDLLILEEGDWFFYGSQKPDFVWKENIWLIAGSEFDLFYKNGEEILSRLRLKDKVLSVSQNSDYAKTKEPAIIESFDKDLVFKKDADKLNNLEGETEGGADRLNNLQGKGKTDQLSSGPLSGKSTGEDSEVDGQYSSPHSGPVREGQELDLENKKNSHETFYKGHNEAEKYDSADLSHEKKTEAEKISTYYNHADKSQRKEQKEANDLSGKSGTDKIPSHYGGAQKSTHQEGPTEKSSQKRAGEEDKGLTGKSSTDKLPSHYGAANKKDTQEVSDKKNPLERSGEKAEGGLSSRTSIDKMGETLTGKTSIERANSQEGRGEGNTGDVIPLVKLDPELAEACQTAKVTSTISFESQVIPCELDDYFDQTIIFLAEQEGLKNESTVDLDLSFNYQKKDTKLEFKGLVTGIDSDEEGKSYITIELSQENVKSFDVFMKLYRARQKSVELFLKRASGL
jgi:hypothetical protein